MNQNLKSKVTARGLVKVLTRNGFKVFTDDSKPFNLNIVNIRSNNLKAGKFDDLQVVFWMYEHKIKFLKFDVTVDPGVPYLLKPLNKKGAAIVVPGQYRGVWMLGKHKGKYDALIQVKDLLVFRDNNRDGFIISKTLKDINGSNLFNNAALNRSGELGFRDYIIYKGTFGINCHRASSIGIVERVGYYSAGCVVHQDPKEYLRFIDLCKKSSIIWGDSFSATWITESDYDDIIN